MTVSKTNIDDDSDEPIPKQILTTVASEMKRHGYDVCIMEQTVVPNHSSLENNAGRTPRFMNDDTETSEIVRNGTAFPFSIEREINGYFGESEGSSNVTTFFVKDDMKIPEVIEKLEVTGQIEAGIEKISPFVAENVSPVDVTAYAIATYAKGWLAEKILASTDRFSKGSVSQDQGGLDLYDREAGEWKQVKCVTKADNSDHLYYQWDCRGGLHFGHSHTEVNKAAGKVSGRVIPYSGEITPTQILRSHTQNHTDETGNSYRYIWW